MLRAGLVRQSSAGVYHLLPLAVRALERLVGVVDRHMKAIGGAKVALPILTPAAQWRASGDRYLHTYTHRHTQTYTHIYTHTYTHMHVQTYTHIHTESFR